MIQAYVDDSSDGNVSLLGGWVADRDEWERFSNSWTATLQEQPRIAYFRHHEAETNPATGQFENWDKTEINAKMAKLVDVICEHQMYGVVVGIKLDTHWKAFEGSVLSKKQLQSVLKLVYPYHYCFFAFTACVFQLERESGNDTRPVDFVFDEQGELFKTCADIYREFKTQFPDELKAVSGNVSEANDKQAPALQAADLLVGQMVTQFRLPQPEPFFQKLVTCHRVLSSTAYVPDFEKIPDIISSLNVTWATKRILDAAQKSDKKQNTD